MGLSNSAFFASMIGKSFPEYIFIRLSIAALQLVTPLSAVYIVYTLYHGQTLITPLNIYAFLEVVFYTFVFLPRCLILQKVLTRFDYLPFLF
jgi:hypothetical protein